MVGRSYPPEFYSWITNTKTRSIFERIAIETEEDYQSLIKILESFQVEVIRPDIPEDSDLVFNHLNNSYIAPPMTPRDYFGMYGNILMHSRDTISGIYNKVKDPSWPEVHTYRDLSELDNKILIELLKVHNISFAEKDTNIMPTHKNSKNIFFGSVFEHIKSECKIIQTLSNTSSAGVVRTGKDLYTSSYEATEELSKLLSSDYRFYTDDRGYHLDSCFCPVVPGLIISVNDITNYEETFPGWEVVYLPDQSWDKVTPFLNLKQKNKGKWWIPGEEHNDDVLETVDTWLSSWVGYVEETVFDVNMLVINEQNVIVNNYNKQVFDALERYGVTPHICNFRHRYFWDGGLHCITSDLDREGEMKDYFPERE
jgi:N-dimethylarginine dimethylaminohydrolase